MSIPMNTYTEMLNVYKEFLFKVMNPFTIPVVLAEFTLLNWLKPMVDRSEILKKLGSTDDTIQTTDLYEEVAKDWDDAQIEGSKKFFEEILNKYIEQVSAVYNYDLEKITL